MTKQRNENSAHLTYYQESSSNQVGACGCSYDNHWRLTWSLTSGLVGLVEVRTS